MADPVQIERYRRPLQSDDGGGTSDDMEARVKLLEYRAGEAEKGFARLEGKIDTLVKDVSEIKGKVSNLPTAWQIFGVIVGTIALLLGSVAVTAAVFRMFLP